MRIKSTGFIFNSCGTTDKDETPLIKDDLGRLPYSPAKIACFFGVLTYLLRFPFVIRYDLEFNGDCAVWYLMAVRVLHGLYPLYFYGHDYEGTLETYILALFFKVFGPSIQLGGAVILMEWALSVGIGVYLLTRGSSKFHGIVGGAVAALGIPYTLTYTTVPFAGNPASVLLSMLFLLQAYFFLVRGPSLARFITFGFTLGLGWYVTKKCLPGIAVSLLALGFLRTDAWELRKSFRPAWGLAAFAAFLLGYLPELLYRLSQTQQQHVLGFAPPQQLWFNLRSALDCSMTYFDAQPMSRMLDGFYFWLRIPLEKVHPQSPLDWSFYALGAGVWIFTAGCFWKGFKEKNIPLFLIAGLIVLNLAALVLSAKTNGDTVNARRYFYPASICFSLMTAFFFSSLYRSRWRGAKILALGLGLAFCGGVAFHLGQLLCSPDELREFRWLVRELDKNGTNQALAPWPYNLMLTGITTERIISAETFCAFVPEYGTIISQSDRIAYFGRVGKDEPGAEMNIGGRTFYRAGDGESDGFFFWTPYQAGVPKTAD